MKRFIGKIENNVGLIENDEFLHMKNVLRMNVGDEVVIICDDEFEYVSKINNFSKKNAVCDVLKVNKCKCLPQREITLFQALIKKENFELVVQKSAELGVAKIVPFTSEFTNAKEVVSNNARVQKIIESAAKQCENSTFLKIDNVVKFDEMITLINDFDCVLFANEREGEDFDFHQLKNAKKIALIVGCEGGFSKIEKQKLINKKVNSISLGKRILKSETASIALCAIASILSGN